MNSKKLLLVVVLVAFILSALPIAGLAQAQKETQEQAKPQEKEKVFIPKDVKEVLEQGLANRQGQTGIPMTVTQHLFFPYYRVQNLIHNVFQIRIKNADLGFAPTAAAAPQAEEKKPEEKKETVSAFEEVPASDMRAYFDLFLQFRIIENNVPGKIVKEVYVPTDILIPADQYKPEAEGIYFVGYDMPPGNYLLIAGIQRMVPGPDKKKLVKLLGSSYYEFTSPTSPSSRASSKQPPFSSPRTSPSSRPRRTGRRSIGIVSPISS